MVFESNELNGFHIRGGTLILFPSAMEHCTASHSNDFEVRDWQSLVRLHLFIKKMVITIIRWGLLILSFGGHTNEGDY